MCPRRTLAALRVQSGASLEENPSPGCPMAVPWLHKCPFGSYTSKLIYTPHIFRMYHIQHKKFKYMYSLAFTVFIANECLKHRPELAACTTSVLHKIFSPAHSAPQSCFVFHHLLHLILKSCIFKKKMLVLTTPSGCGKGISVGLIDVCPGPAPT